MIVIQLGTCNTIHQARRERNPAAQRGQGALKLDQNRKPLLRPQLANDFHPSHGEKGGRICPESELTICAVLDTVTLLASQFVVESLQVLLKHLLMFLNGCIKGLSVQEGWHHTSENWKPSKTGAPVPFLRC